jgi:hypothetical protein
VNCKCGKPLTKWNGETWKTLVGYGGPPGHVHDDNCNKREYFCDDGHANFSRLRLEGAPALQRVRRRPR